MKKHNAHWFLMFGLLLAAAAPLACSADDDDSVSTDASSNGTDATDQGTDTSETSIEATSDTGEASTESSSATLATSDDTGTSTAGSEIGAKCSGDGDCGGEFNTCQDFGQLGMVCTKACQTDTDCPAASQGSKCNQKGFCRP